MMKHFSPIFFCSWILLALSCGFSNEAPANHSQAQDSATATPILDTLPTANEAIPLTAADIHLDTALLHHQYVLEDLYEYEKQTRDFNWEEIKGILALIENIQEKKQPWGVVQNYKNRNGESPLVKKFARNRYGRVADTLGVERYQSAPLYTLADTLKPEIYGRDGFIFHILGKTASFYHIQDYKDSTEWYIPQRYLLELPDTTVFHHVVVVDRKDQNITTLEWKDKGHWTIRSKNPATTGRNRPPYAQPTPLGIFLIQEQKKRMIYLKDGSTERDGFAPYASRFTNGAYIHGVPVKAPGTRIIEWSWSLGTTPRSHMCVRNASSHAQFVYEWAPVRQSLVVVIE